MEENNKMKKTVWENLQGWQVVSAVSLLLLGIGGGIMTTPHPYIADAFFFVGFSLLLVKFWAWGEAKHSTTRKTAILLAGVTVLTVFVFAGSCWLSYYLSLPKQAVVASSPQTSQPKTSTQPVTLTEQSKLIAPTKGSQSTSDRPAKKKFYISKPNTTPSPAATKLGGPTPEKPLQVIPPQTYQQTCVGSACAQGNGAQATYNQYGPRSWESMFDGDKQNALIVALGQAQGKVKFTWIFQDMDGLQMAGFLNAAFEKAHWILDSGQTLGEICYPQKPGDCSGLYLAVRDRKSDIAKTAITALSAFVPDLKVNESDKVPDGRVEVFVGKAN